MPLMQRMFPFTAAPIKSKPAADIPKLNPVRILKIRALGIDFNHTLSSFATGQRAGFEEATYDFERIIEAIDTDSYIKQGFMKYKELFWKEGWEIIGENQEAVQYLYRRLDLIEEIMDRPLNDYLASVVDNLVKFGNAFVVEARADIAKYFPGKLHVEEGQLPIAGYYTIPTETVRIKRDKLNRPVQYQQAITDLPFTSDSATAPTFKASEVLHFYLDKKDGRAFGTPFIVSVLDDVIAYRQIEEDVQNLIHRELFPLYKYKVGTDVDPALPGDVEAAAEQLANLRVEGGLIIPNTHDVEVIGGEGKALEVSNYLQMMRERVIAGMGLSSHHLGIMNQGGNRAITDRLDIALYDKIKTLQHYFENAVRLYIFNPLLREGGFDLSSSTTDEDKSNRCYMKFREIDKDTQVKMQTHYINMFANNVIDLEEVRLKLGEDPTYNIEHLLMTLSAHIQTVSQMAVAQHSASMAPETTIIQKKSPTGSSSSKTTTKAPAGLPAPKKPDAQNPSTGILPNMPNAKKGPGNIMKPSNQTGRKMSPNIRHMDDDVLNTIVELIDESRTNE